MSEVIARIDKDEWWPVYTIDDEKGAYGRKVRVDKSLIERFARAAEEFEAVQVKLQNLYDRD